LLKWNDLKASSTIYPGDVVKLGSSGNSAAGTSSKVGSSSGSYTIQAGDTLSGIAAKQGLSLSALLRTNGLSVSSVIFPGQTLTLSDDASTSSVSTASSSSTSDSSGGSYKVKSGDTLSGIAASQNEIGRAS